MTLHMFMSADIDEENKCVTLTFNNVPLDHLDEVLSHIGGAIRQSIVDGVKAQTVARDLGINETTRHMHVRDGKLQQ